MCEPVTSRHATPREWGIDIIVPMRTGQGLTLAVVAWVLAGCCALVPDAEKYFDRWLSPEETLKGFVYAVETEQWDFAYECLSAATQKEVGRFKFQAVIRWASDPALHDVPVYAVISESVRARTRPVIEGRRAWIRVAPIVKNRAGDLGLRPLQLYFSFDEERGEWLFDLLETINTLAGAPPALN